jgi:hypothetical protein
VQSGGALNQSNLTSDRTLSFTYGPEHQRTRQDVVLSGNYPSALSSNTTWYLHGQGTDLGYEKVQFTNGLIEHRHFVSAGASPLPSRQSERATSTASRSGRCPTCTTTIWGQQRW